jgi:hypothetical protein
MKSSLLPRVFLMLVLFSECLEFNHSFERLIGKRYNKLEVKNRIARYFEKYRLYLPTHSRHVFPFGQSQYFTFRELVEMVQLSCLVKKVLSCFLFLPAQAIYHYIRLSTNQSNGTFSKLNEFKRIKQGWVSFCQLGHSIFFSRSNLTFW